jgi:hypothetical protein
VETKDKEEFVFKIDKSKNMTRISGGSYNEFLLDYDMKHGDQIRLDIDNEPPYLFMYPLDKDGYPKERVVGSLNFLEL